MGGSKLALIDVFLVVIVVDSVSDKEGEISTSEYRTLLIYITLLFILILEAD